MFKGELSNHNVIPLHRACRPRHTLSPTNHIRSLSLVPKAQFREPGFTGLIKIGRGCANGLPNPEKSKIFRTHGVKEKSVIFSSAASDCRRNEPRTTRDISKIHEPLHLSFFLPYRYDSWVAENAVGG